MNEDINVNEININEEINKLGYPAGTTVADLIASGDICVYKLRNAAACSQCDWYGDCAGAA